MPLPSRPCILVEIDENSRIRVLQDPGCRVLLLDRRVDPQVLFLPERNQADELVAAVRDLPIHTRRWTDPARTAFDLSNRLEQRLIVVAGFKENIGA